MSSNNLCKRVKFSCSKINSDRKALQWPADQTYQEESSILNKTKNRTFRNSKCSLKIINYKHVKKSSPELEESGLLLRSFFPNLFFLILYIFHHQFFLFLFPFLIDKVKHCTFCHTEHIPYAFQISLILIFHVLESFVNIENLFFNRLELILNQRRDTFLKLCIVNSISIAYLKTSFFFSNQSMHITKSHLSLIFLKNLIMLVHVLFLLYH